MKWYFRTFPDRIIENGIPEETAQPVLVQMELPGNRIEFDVAFYESGEWIKEDRSGERVEGKVIAWTPIVQEKINLKQHHCTHKFKKGRIFDQCIHCGAIAERIWIGK